MISFQHQYFRFGYRPEWRRRIPNSGHGAGAVSESLTDDNKDGHAFFDSEATTRSVNLQSTRRCLPWLPPQMPRTRNTDSTRSSLFFKPSHKPPSLAFTSVLPHALPYFGRLECIKSLRRVLIHVIKPLGSCRTATCHEPFVA